MKIALVCDWLTDPGGAEKVLLELHHMYPDAPIYTSQYRPRRINWFNTAKVRVGWLNLFPACLRKFLGVFRQIYFSHLDLSAYDLVISVTGAEAKSVRTKSKYSSQNAYHVCYCHVPTQYYWQLYDHYLENPGFGLLNPLVRFFFKLLVRPLRRADYRAAQNIDQFVTISSYAKDQILRYYHRKSIIISPPVDLQQFSTKKTDLSTGFPQVFHKFSTSFPQYYIIACRQVNWKRVDLAITACQNLRLPLLVVGDGAEHSHLVALAKDSPFIEFLPWATSGELSAYLQRAKGYIFPSLEPFGIAAVEALAAGCPVLAYAEGGSRDIIQPGRNGLLFSEQTPASLTKALKTFDYATFDPVVIAASAQQFSRTHFRSQIQALIRKHISKGA